MSRDSIPSTRQPVVDGRGIITEPWLRFFKAMYDTTGGSSETYITDNSTTETTQTEGAGAVLAMIAQQELRNIPTALQPVDYKQFYSKELGRGKFTAGVWDFIEATNDSFIYLPAYPSDNDVVIIANGDGSNITVDGNGKLINRADQYIIRKRDRTLIFHFFAASGKWRIR